MPYTFRQIPDVNTVEELRQWLSEELKLISESLNESIELELRASKHEPERPREGMIVHADGTAWDPGAGAGTYIYRSGAWQKIVTGTGVTFASTTEQLTGTEAAKASTPDSVAALWEKGSDVASTGTLSLGEGGYFHVTGTTNITDIDFATAKDGRWAVLVFDGALTLTHNATTLILPSGANIVTVAGDACCVVQDASDNVKVVWYQRKDGHALVETAPPPTPAVLQVLQTTNTANTDLTTAIPFDDTVPTNTEGTSVLSQAITPASSSNKVLCEVDVWGSSTLAGNQICVALFRGTTCIAAVAHSENAAVQARPVTLTFLDSPATTSATTYEVRVGPPSGTVRLNGIETARRFGGVGVSTLTLSEIKG